MEKPEDAVKRFKSIAQISERDESWKVLGDYSLEQHHGLVEPYTLHTGVPAIVTQGFENARNTWLYSFFSHPLLELALAQLHWAGELAIKERARLGGVDTKRKRLQELLEMAITEGWLLDKHFEMLADKAERQAKHFEMLRYFRIPFDPDTETIPEQDYAKDLVEAFRQIRNDLGHGEPILRNNLNWEFTAIRDLINQLFPQSIAKAAATSV